MKDCCPHTHILKDFFFQDHVFYLSKNKKKQTNKKNYILSEPSWLEV